MNTFSVTNSGMSAYSINGVNNKTLDLFRGVTYSFTVTAPGHPFWIQTTNSAYDNTNIYPGVSNNGTQNGTIVFNVPLDAPNTLYYVCEYHSVMKGTINITDNGACYSKGSLILTNQGYVPIENIKEGDKVVTKGKISNNGFLENNINNNEETVIWIGKYKVKNLNSTSRPICIKKDALGKDYPFVDLYVSPGHRLLLNNQMITANNIINDKTIYQDNNCEFVEYYHLECKEHSAIYANGVLAETYIESDNRSVFENTL